MFSSNSFDSNEFFFNENLRVFCNFLHVCY